MIWANRGCADESLASNGWSRYSGRSDAIGRQYWTQHPPTPLCDTRAVRQPAGLSCGVSVPWRHHVATLAPLSAGIGDPTAHRTETAFTFARSSDVVRLTWTVDGCTTDYHLSAPDEHLLGLLVGSRQLIDQHASRHEAVARATRIHRSLRIAGNGEVFAESVKAVLGQRITGREAALQWARLVRLTGTTLEHPWGSPLWSTPDPSRVCALSTADFHCIGIERRRAHTIRLLADLARRGALRSIATMKDLHEATRDVTGFGPWTLAVASGNAFGDPDALPVGDFHLKNTVAWAIAGNARGSDDEMVAHLAPYVGSRWWVVRCLSLEHRAPRFSHRRVNPDFRRW